MLSIKAIKLILIFNLSAIITCSANYSSNAAADENRMSTTEISGGTNVCYNTPLYYRTISKSSSGECDYFYTWRVTGGEFSDGSQYVTGYGEFYVYVTWFTGQDAYSLDVLVSGETPPPNASCTPTAMEKEGNLTPVFTGDTDGDEPILSNWTFNDIEATSTSYLCTNSNTISVNEIEGENPNNYDIETKLSYYNDEGETVIIKDWEESIFSNPYVSIDFDNLHKQVTFLSESRYSDCIGTRSTEEFVIDFYKIPEFERTDLTHPQCAGDGGSVTFSLLNTKLSSVIIGLTLSDDFISFQIEAEDDSIFTIDNTLTFKEYSPIDKKFVDRSIELLPGDYQITMEPQILKDSTETEYPCFVSDSFTINEVPTDSIVHDTSPSTIACFDDTTTLSFQIARQGAEGATFDYKLFDANSDNELDSILNTSDEVNFSVGLGDYYIKGKKSGCEWNPEAVIESNDVRIDTHSLTFADTASTNQDRSNGLSILCYGDNTGSISIEATDVLSGNLDYWLRKHNGNSWDVYDIKEDVPNESSVTFTDLPEGQYKVRVKYSGCDSWTVRDDKVIESNTVSITGPQSAISVLESVSMTRPTCAGGSDGSFIFSAEGGNGSPYTITNAVVTNNSDGQNDSFNNMTINNLSAGAIVSSITVEDDYGCSETIDIPDVEMLAAENPFQFSSQITKDPNCTDSVAVFKFSYLHQSGSVNLNLLDSDSNNVNGVENIVIRTDSIIFSGDARIPKYILILDDGNSCEIVSDTISFNIPDRPELANLSFATNEVASYQGNNYIICFNQPTTATLDITNADGENSNFTVEKDGEAIDSSLFFINNNHQLVINEVNTYDSDSAIYEIFAQDENDCPYPNFQFTIYQAPAPLDLSNSSAFELFNHNEVSYHVSYHDASDGKFIVDVQGGLENESDFGYYVSLQKNGDNTSDDLQESGSEYFFENLEANVEYTVIIEDELGCAQDTSFMLRAPDPIEIYDQPDSYNDEFDIACKGESTEIEVSTSGGIFPHDVQLIRSDGDTTSYRLESSDEVITFTGVIANNYHIEVSDKKEEGSNLIDYTHTKAFSSFEITQPSDEVSFSLETTKPTCFYGEDGEIKVTPLGGVKINGTNYKIRIKEFDKYGNIISQETTDQHIWNDAAGSYYVEVEDANGCIVGEEVEIENIEILQLDNSSITYPICEGDNTGTITVNATGGRGFYSENQGYKFTLQKLDGQTIEIVDEYQNNSSYTFQNLYADDYEVIIYDSAECSITEPITLSERPDPLLINGLVYGKSTCSNTKDASIEIYSEGGDGNHQLSIDNGANWVSSNEIDTTIINDFYYEFTGLEGGRTYEILVEDENSCRYSDSIFIPLTDSVSVDISKLKHVTCTGGNDGEITLSPSYGNVSNVNKFSYEWFILDGPKLDGESGHEIDSLPAGAYQVRVTYDGIQCSRKTYDIKIKQANEPLVLSDLQVSDYNCEAGGNILLQAKILGGWQLDNSSVQIDNQDWGDITPEGNGDFYITAGLTTDTTHILRIRDSQGCELSETFDVNNSKPALSTIEKTDVSCHNDSDGQIFIKGEYAEMDYTLFVGDSLIRNRTQQDSVIFTALPSGVYRIVANRGPCVSDTVSVTINNPDPLSVNPIILQDASCGKSNGKLSVQINGGVPFTNNAYDTVWRNRNDVIVDPNQLTSGNYTVRVADKNNCYIEESVFLPEVSDVEIEFSDIVHTTCGLDNGQVNLKVDNAVRPFKIYWNNIALDESEGLIRDGLATGNYSIKVVDALGCEQDTTIQIQDSEGITVSLETATYTACGLSNGYVELSVEGATGGYEIEWPENITEVDQNSAEGFYGGVFYDVVVTDSLGCSADFKFKVPTRSDLEIFSAVSLPSCGNHNGSINVEVLGGIPPYDYEWSVDSLNGDSISGLSPGEYILTVKDSVGCTDSKVFTLYDDESIYPDYDLRITDPSCLNNDGIIEVSLTDSTTNFNISWLDFPDNTQIREELSAGNYTAILSNDEGCYREIPIELELIGQPVLNDSITSDPICGNDNGKIIISTNDDIQVYHWSHDVVLNSSIAGDLPPGDYWVVGQNSLGCTTDTLNFTLDNVNTDLQARVLGEEPASCLDSPDGSITVEGFNGHSPYQYQWNDPHQQTTATATGLFPGDYSVTITDSGGCEQVLQISLGARDPLEILSFESIQPTCSDGSDGQISVNLIGGNGNYEYEWSNGETGIPLTAVAAGTYNLTVYDGEYCSIEGEFTLQAPDPIVVNQILQSPVCNGESNGYAQLNVSGGTGDYNVLWPDGNTSFIRNDLSRGTYEVLVSDENDCETSIEVIIPEKPEITYDYEIVPPQCPGDQNAVISLHSINHVDNPLIRWSNGRIGATLNNIGAGDHVFNIVDNDNCSFTDTITVYDPEPLQIINPEISHPTCNGRRNGAITFDIEGGTGDYEYRWNDGSRNQNRFNLGDGSYELTITDGNNCPLIREFNLQEPEPIQVETATISNVSCFNVSDGSIFLNIAGGTGEYQFDWSDGHESKDRSAVSAGLYSVTISDENNCSASFEYRINQPNPISISAEYTQPSCNGAEDGRIDVTVSGGTSPYQIDWLNGTTGEILDNISAGTYEVEITDSMGCNSVRKLQLNQPNELRVTGIEKSNPVCYQEATGYAKIFTTGGAGNIEIEWEDGLISNERNDLVAGNYQVTLRDENNCTNQFEFSLEDPQDFAIDGIPSEVLLCGGGSIVLDAGTWDTYNWTSDNGFSSDQKEVDISAEGNYTLEVATELGCSAEVNFEVIKGDDLLSADFLLTSEAVVGDTVVIVDISWPMPDSISWDNMDDPDIYEVSQNSYYQEVIFTDTGSFDMGMYAYVNFCQDYVRKDIQVIAREDADNTQAQRTLDVNRIDFKLNIYPNPNYGQFKLDIKSNQLADIEVKILDFSKGNIVKGFRGKASNRFVFEIRDESLSPGVYLVLVKSGSVVKTEKFIIK